MSPTPLPPSAWVPPEDAPTLLPASAWQPPRAAKARFASNARTGGRVAWGLIDQGLSSLSNFGLSAVVARSVSAHSFGVFALAFTFYLLFMNVARAAGTGPMVMRYSVRSEPTVLAIAPRVGGSGVGIGAVAGLGFVLASLATTGDLRWTLLVLGLALPFLLLQDAWRFVFLTVGRPDLTALLDGIWLGLQVLAVAAVLVSHHRSTPLLVAAWSAAAAGSALYGSLRLRAIPRPGQALGWWKQNRDLVQASIGDVGFNIGSSQVTTYALVGLVGAAAAGATRGAVVLFGPLTLIYQGAMFVAVPEVARFRAKYPSRFVRSLMALAATLSLAALATTGASLLLPNSIGRQVLGATWPLTRSILLPIGLALTCSMLTAGAAVGFGVLAAARPIFRAQAWTGSLLVIGGIGGALVGGLRGYAWGALASGVISVVIYWSYLARTLRTHDGGPAGPDLRTPAPVRSPGHPSDGGPAGRLGDGGDGRVSAGDGGNPIRGSDPGDIGLTDLTGAETPAP